MLNAVDVRVKMTVLKYFEFLTVTQIKRGGGDGMKCYYFAFPPCTRLNRFEVKISPPLVQSEKMTVIFSAVKVTLV